MNTEIAMNTFCKIQLYIEYCNCAFMWLNGTFESQESLTRVRTWRFIAPYNFLKMYYLLDCFKPGNACCILNAVLPVLLGLSSFSNMFGKKKKRLEISAPSNFEHRVHTGFDPREQKFTGLPQQWQSLLADTANRPKPMVDPSYITPIQLAPMKVHNNSSALRVFVAFLCSLLISCMCTWFIITFCEKPSFSERCLWTKRIVWDLKSQLELQNGLVWISKRRILNNLYVILSPCFSRVLNVIVYMCAEFRHRGVYRITVHTYPVTVLLCFHKECQCSHHLLTSFHCL